MSVRQRYARAVRHLRIRRMRGDVGLSVMEVVVAMTIIGAVMASASLFFLNGLKATSGQGQRQTAVTLANQALEAARSVPAEDGLALIAGRTCSAVYALTSSTAGATITAQDQVATSATDTSADNCDTSGGTGTAPIQVTAPPKTVSGTVYTITTYVNVCWLKGAISSGNCTKTSATGLTKIYRVSVDVSYAKKAGLSCAGLTTGNCDYVASTLIDPTEDPSFNSNVSTPSVANASPSSVVIGASAKNVTLTGTGFVDGIAVTVPSGAGTVTDIVSNTGSTLTFTLNTTTATAGTYVVTLLNPDGGTTTTNITINPLPNITSITPATATLGATTALTINGTGFASGATISIDGGGTLSAQTIVSSIKATVSFTSNGTTSGTRTITLTNTDTGSDTGTFDVISAPTLTTIAPNPLGCSSSGVTMTLTGTRFVSGATVSDGADTFGSVTVSSSTSATVSVLRDKTSSGTRTLTFKNPDNGSTTKTFTATACSQITSVSPVSPTTFTSGGTITLNGVNFVSGSTITMVSGSTSVTVSSATFVSSTKYTFKATMPASLKSKTSTYTITVTNPDGSSDSETVSIKVA